MVLYLNEPFADEYLGVGELIDLFAAQLLAFLQRVQHLIVLLHGGLVVLVQHLRDKVLPQAPEQTVGFSTPTSK